MSGADKRTVAPCECPGCPNVERVYFDSTCGECHESRVFGESHDHKGAGK